MVTSTNPKPRPVSAIDPILERDDVRKAPPEIRIRNEVQSSNGNTFKYVVLALILLFGGYMIYNYTTDGNSVNILTNKSDVLPTPAAPVPSAPIAVSPKVDVPASNEAPNPPAATGTVQPAAPSTTTTP